MLTFGGPSVSFYEAMEAAGARIIDYGEFCDESDAGGLYLCASFEGELLFACWLYTRTAYEDYWDRVAPEDDPRIRPSDEEIVAFGRSWINRARPFEQFVGQLRRLGLRKEDRIQVFGWLRRLPALHAYRAQQRIRAISGSLAPGGRP